MIEELNKIKGKKDKIKYLINRSKIKLYLRSDKDIELARNEFRSLNITHRDKKCSCCNKKAEAIHHIILLKFGGDISGNNIVPVCNICHERIHPWMR